MANQNGNPNSFFIAEVRRIFRDQAVQYGESQPTDGATGGGVAGSKPFRVQRAPIWKGFSPLITGPQIGGFSPDYLPVLDPAAGPTTPPTLVDAATGGVAGVFNVYYTLAGGAPSPIASINVAIGPLRITGGLPSPIPAGGAQIWAAVGPTGIGGSGNFGLLATLAAGATPPYTMVTQGDQTIQTFFNTDTGEVFFAFPPPLGSLAISYQAFRYSDQQILDALGDGLNLLWPEIWNWITDTTSILVSPTQYEYALPAAFQDNRCILRTVEFAPPSGIVRYFKTSLWRQVEDPTNPMLVFQRIPPVASQVRLGYVRPLATLAETPFIAQNLPVYYALARLCMDQETMRGRSDDLPALSGEGAAQPGTALNTASYWLQQFSTQLTRLGLDEPTRRTVQNRAVERLGLSDLWTDIA